MAEGVADVSNELTTAGRNIVPFFANYSHVWAGPDSVRLTFGEGLPNSPVNYHTSIVLTPANAKAMAELVLRLVASQAPHLMTPPAT
jgi:hypothetical protein